MNRFHMPFAFALFILCSCSGSSVGEIGTIGGSSRVNVHPAAPRAISIPDAADTKEYDSEMIAAALKKADFEFYNSCIYNDPDAWKGRTVCVLGEFPGTGPRSRQYVRNRNEFYLQGDFNGHPIAIIVNLDHALPVQIAYGKPVPRIFPLQEIYVFGTLQGTQSITNEDGYTRTLPLLQCLFIYDKDDNSFRRPLWVSSAFERPPEGTVTTDSLKYEFDRPKTR